MKPIFFIFCSTIMLLACSKEDTLPQALPTPEAPAIDYSVYKLKTVTHSQRNYSGTSSTFSADTSNYTYNGTSINYQFKNRGVLSDYQITLENGLYTQVSTTATSSKAYYRLNAAGLIDSNWYTYNSLITQGGSYRYNADNSKDSEVYNYSGYTNTRKFYYQNGVAAYSLQQRISYHPSVVPAKDSVTYEYTSLPLRADFFNTGMSVFLYGKPDKHLLKKATYYNQLNSNVIRQTTEYLYKTNDIGLVTQKVLNMYTQPGNTLMLTDTTNYTYNK